MLRRYEALSLSFCECDVVDYAKLAPNHRVDLTLNQDSN